MQLIISLFRFFSHRPARLGTTPLERRFAELEHTLERRRWN